MTIVNILLGPTSTGTGVTNPPIGTEINTAEPSIAVNAIPDTGSYFQQFDVYDSAGNYVQSFFTSTMTLVFADTQYTIIVFFSSVPVQTTKVNILLGPTSTGNGTTNPPIGTEINTSAPSLDVTATPDANSVFQQFDIYDSTGTFVTSYFTPTMTLVFADTQYTIIVFFRALVVPPQPDILLPLAVIATGVVATALVVKYKGKKHRKKKRRR